MKTPFTTVAGAAAATGLIALSTVSLSTPAYAASQTIVGQGAYVCQSAPKGLPTETYNVTIRMSLNAPASVAPGQTVSLSGSMSMQFPEKAYQEGKQYGETEADGYSNTLSVGATFNGATTDVLANRWQTAPFPWTDPVTITAPITLHAFTVPANASGSLTLRLPRNERRAPNTASSNPATVAFNGVANNKTVAGNIPENLGCYLQSPPSVIANIPITRSAQAPAATGGGVSATTTGGGAPGTKGGVTTQPVVGGSVPGSSVATGGSLPGSAPGTAPVTSTGGLPVVESPGGVQPVTYVNAPPRSGVFIPTSVMIMVGILICIAALAYAALTQYRLRNIKRSMDG